MTDVFLSYKSEDSPRIVRLARALEGAGFSVWWDRSGLSPGENYRVQISQVLDAAGCVLVAWSEGSVGPAGEWVRDEATRGKERGVLVPVLVDDVRPPLGFRETQFVDLRHWKGSAADPFFQDLCAALRATIDRTPIPPARGPTRRLLRRLAIGSLASVTATAAAVALGLFVAQDQVCRAPVGQPHLSDGCGALGLGQRPQRAERLAWEGLAAGDCAALRAHGERFPDGAFRREVNERLAARRITEAETWDADTRALELHGLAAATGERGPEAARTATLAAAQTEAERMCRSFGSGTLFRYVAARPEARTWDCVRQADGFRCSFDGQAVCVLQRRVVQEVEHCDP